MYLIVGLGNPGRKYMHTRHNVGFDVVEVLSQKYDIPIQRLRCKAAVGEGTIRGQRVALAQPQTFMNLSGESVVQLCNWYKPENDHLIVVFDDVDLPEGKLRFRTSGSAISPSEASPAKTKPYCSQGIISRSPSRTRRSSSVKKTLSMYMPPCLRLHIKSALFSANVCLCPASSGAGSPAFQSRVCPRELPSGRRPDYIY